LTNYATAKSIRRYTGLKVDDIPDADLEEYLNDADRDVVDDISISRWDDVMSGAINGTNVEFFVQSKPLADTDFDRVVSTVDIKVYKWGTSGSIDSKEEVTISTINAQEGRIILSSAPANTYDVLTANYRFYPSRDTISWTLVERAASLIAGYYYIMAEYILIPERYARGAIRYIHAKPYYTILDEYYRIINRINTRNYAKKETEETTLRRKMVEEMV